MKKKMLVGGLLFACLSGAAFTIVGLVGVPEQHLAPRGTDEYYSSDPIEYALGEVSVNLKSKTGSQYLQVDLAVKYVVGPEIEGQNASGIFESNRSDVEDQLNILLSDKTYEQVSGRDNKLLLKEEIRETLQKIIFPDKKGRIEQIFFRKFYVQ